MGQRRDTMLVGRKTEGVIVPPNLTLDRKGRLEPTNSSLSENVVLGVPYQSPIVRAGRNRTCCSSGKPRFVHLKVTKYFAETVASL